jgi:hypothetical protein
LRRGKRHDVCKLRIKVGTHEFEAEGAQEYVEGRYESFVETLERFGFAKATPQDPADAKNDGAGAAAAAARAGTEGQTGTPATGPATVSLDEIRRIAHQQDELITLTALPGGDSTEADGLILLLLAHKVMRNVDSVSTDDLLAGMKQSGFTVDRLDRIVKGIDALVIRTGVKRGTKYRLTNPGLVRAKAIAERLLKTVA